MDFLNYVYVCVFIYLSVYLSIIHISPIGSIIMKAFPWSQIKNTSIFLKYILPANIILDNCIVSDADLRCKYF